MCAVSIIYKFFFLFIHLFVYIKILYYRNPYNPDCLAPYKGPVIPDIAFGGYLREGQISADASDYIGATGLVLTFMVRNSVNQSEIEPMLIWEQK